MFVVFLYVCQMSRVYMKIPQQSDCPLAFFFPLISIDSAPPKAIYAGTTGNRLSICPETAYQSPIETSPLDGSHDVMISHRIHRNFVWTGVAIFTDIYFYQHVMFDFYRSSCTTVQWIGVM